MARYLLDKIVAGGIMKITVDIGNSLISIGFFTDDELKETLTINTNLERSYDLYKADLKALIRDKNISSEKVTHVIIASVVPQLTHLFKDLFLEICNVEPLILDAGVKTGLALKIDNPKELGSDLVAVSVGALSLLKPPFLIVDLGTANKFLYIDEEGRLAGAVFTPGLLVSLEALVDKTAQLPSISMQKPRFILGRNTKDSMNSGVIYGNAALVSELSKMIEKEVNTNLKKVLTGGNAVYIKDELDKDEFLYIEHLIHFGLLIILNKNCEVKKNG